MLEAKSDHLTTDPRDPRLDKYRGRGSDYGKTDQHDVYLVLPDTDDDTKLVRPVRQSYTHTTCQGVTTMALAIARTFSQDPKFYTHTFCTKCSQHKPVSEFRWLDGTAVGS